MAELTELQFGRGKKRKSTPQTPATDYKKCIICQKAKSEPLYNLTERGYSGILFAVQNREDDTARRLLPEVTGKDVFLGKAPKYHLDCRSRYNNKKSVEQRKCSKPEDNDASNQNLQKSVITRSFSKAKIDYKKVCFVCEKSRDKKGDRKLILVGYEKRQDKIFQKALQLNDSDMLHKIEDGGKCLDMVANDFRYHKGCLDGYMLKRIPNKGGTDDENECHYQSAFESVMSEIEEKVLNEHSVYFISQLRDKVRQLLMDKKVDNVCMYTSKKLVKQLENFVGDKVVIVPQVGTSSLLCSSALSLATVLAEVKTLKSSLDEWDYLEYDEVDRSDDLDNSLDHSRFQHESYHSAKAIQKQVRDTAKQRRQDTAENESGESDLDISFEGASKVVPIDLYNHLAWLIHDATFEMGPDGRVSLSKKQHEQVLNVSQDIIAAMSST